MPHDLCQRAAGAVVYYVSPLLERAGVRHAFTTRLGGVSPPPFDSLNLGNSSTGDIQDDRRHIEANCRLIQAAIGCLERRRCSVHQVHGSNVVTVAAGQSFGYGLKADALVCDDARSLISIRTADCVPILLASADGRCVGAVHAGWRGVVAGIALAAVGAMRKLAGDAKLLAAIGPAIGPEAFEVGDEVLAQFENVFGSDAPLRRRPGGKGHVDMRRALKIQLSAAGIQDIDATDLCTFGLAAEFFSHRRDRGITGRMAAFIAPRRPSTSLQATPAEGLGENSLARNRKRLPGDSVIAGGFAPDSSAPIPGDATNEPGR